MKECLLLHENLFAFSEKQLPEPLMQLIEAHLTECKSCSDLVKKFESVLATANNQKSIELRPFAETRLQQRIETYLEKKAHTRVSLPTVRWRPVFISLGLLASLALGVVLGSHRAEKYDYNNTTADIEMRTELNISEDVTVKPIDFTE